MTDRPSTRIDAPWLKSPPARRVMATLAAAGGDPRFVGGSVRDAVLGRTASDLDIASRLAPEDAMAALERDGIATVPTGLAHGTVTAVLGADSFEITTLRRDVATDGRHAEVAFTDDWREDAARRDFTMNALSADIDGNVYDYFGGLEDLRAGRVVCVGDPEQRFAEDYLRILRFFRFHSVYGAETAYDVPALDAAIRLRGNLVKLSGERLRQETLKILASRQGPLVWADMASVGISTTYLPEALWVERLAAVAIAESESPHLAADPIRRLAAVLIADAEPGRPTVAERLRLSGAERDRLDVLMRKNPGRHLFSDNVVRRTLYAHGRDLTLDLLALAFDDAPSKVAFSEAIGLAVRLDRPTFPLAGRDVVALGLTPGPEIGRLLKAVERWWIEADFAPDRDACLARLEALAGNAGPA